METPKRTNYQIFKKFLEPMSKSSMMKGVILRAMIHPLLAGFIAIVIVEVMRSLIEFVEVGNLIDARVYLWYFIGAVTVWLVSRTLSKDRGYSELRPKGQNYFYKKYLEEYVALDNNVVETLGTGRIQHIIDSGIRSWIMILGDSTVKLTKYFSKIIFGILFVFTIDVWYGLLFIVLIFLIMGIYVITQSKANVSRRKIKDLHIELSRDVVRVIMSKFEVLQSGKLQKDLEKYDSWLEDRLPLNKKIETQRLLSEGFSVIMIDGIRVLAIISLLYGLLSSSLSIADFVAISSIAMMLDDITRGFSRYYIDTSKQFIHLEKLRNLFDTTASIIGYEEGEQFMYKQGNIIIDSVDFKYEEEGTSGEEKQSNIFEDLSLTMTGGKKTALVGVSGSGKSTLVKLIAGYLRPTNGSIGVDGQDLTTVSLKSYYKHIGYLTQEPNVFDGSIIDNLSYSIDGEVSSERIEECIGLAKCEFIRDLPQGIETEIGERGIRLSGGQRQRLAIAKIFLKDPKIVILDEPTSALDSFSEEAITEAMKNLFKDRTVIIIAHRLQTVKHADDIIVMEQGKVLERGTHQELIELGGSYARMLELQSGF